LAAKSLIVIWVSAAELSSPGTDALVHTAREALGPSMEVRVVAAAEGERPGPSTPNSGVVELSWDTASGAHLHCYVPSSHRWIDRSVTFGSDDPPFERGRTLGFLVASIFVEEPRREREKTRPPPARPLAPPVVSPKAPRPATRAGAAAAMTVVGPGDGTSFGGRIVLDYRVLSGVRVGLAGEARFGTLTSAQATSRVLGVGGQVTWEAWRPEPHSYLGPSLAAYATELRITHLSPEGPVAVSKSHWFPAVQPVLGGGLAIGAASAAFAEMGAEIVAGRTTVMVEGERRARTNTVTPTARIGLRTEF
jgi:hypothetical protein